MTATKDSPRTNRSAIVFVFLTVCIDAIGFGIIIPVLPDLIAEVSNTTISGAALWGGYLSFSYAVMQFAFGPAIGNLSDRYGRRPVLLVSLFMLAADFLIMALAPSLLVLFIGRILAGIAAATHSTANAVMADLSSREDRARNFGIIGAAFGVGFIIGPVIGGIAGEFGTRAPFFTAAALAFANFCFGALVLPESLAPEKRRPFDWKRANPGGGFIQLRKLPMVMWFMVCVFIFEIANFAYPAVWAYYTKEAFKWSSAEVGLSLAAFGLGFALVQGWLIRFILARLGEARTVIFGFAMGIAGLIGFSFANQGWMIYALLPISALGGVATPALNALMANCTPDDAQGELQGLRTSVVAIVMVISPLVMTQLFGYFTRGGTPVYFPGAPFLAAAVLTALALIPFYAGLRVTGVTTTSFR
jgi:DHA1 family tetracycline resistance protein-like MFS transporter